MTGVRESWQSVMLSARPCRTYSEYMGNAGRKERSDALNSAIDKMTKKTRDLRRQLRKAVMDHVSDSFLETNVPLFSID